MRLRAATHQWELGELLHVAEARASENAAGSKPQRVAGLMSDAIRSGHGAL